MNEGWYEYYAGYSEAFVQDVIESVAPCRERLILDPWNGSGTTTAVAHHQGFRSVGLDGNPALVVVGKARALDPGVLPSLGSLRADVLQKARTLRRRTTPPPRTDPLRWWFTADAAHRLRCIDAAIFDLLVDHSQPNDGWQRVPVDELSTLAAFFYVALFKTTRSFLKTFKTSNPTWIRRAEPNSRIRLSGQELARAFRDDLESIASRIDNNSNAVDGATTPSVRLGFAEDTGLDEGSVGAVIGSPPYCTRIDYAVNTLPELAILGIGRDASQFRELRDSLTGTPTIAKSIAPSGKGLGRTCNRFLRMVADHPSKASDTYYLKYFKQYFDSLRRSLDEISRVLSPSGSCVLVLQDSYYKEIHCDLQKIAFELGRAAGLEPGEQVDFVVPRVRASMNTRSRVYREDFSSVESALFLTKPN